MDQRLRLARDVCADGRVGEAIDLVASIVGESSDEKVLVSAAEVVPRPIDPVTRARLHLVVAHAASRVVTPELRQRLNVRLAETFDHFRPAANLSPTVLDDYAIAGDRATLLDAIAASTGEATTPLERSRVHLLLASQAVMDGRFDDAIGHVEDAVSLGGEGSDAFYLDPVFRSSIARLTGDGLDKLVPMVRGIVELLPFSARGWLALMLKAAGERDECARLWKALAPHVSDFPPNAPEFLIGMASNAELCTWLGDRETGQILYERILPYAGKHAIAHATGPYEGPIDLALGRLALLLGNREAAREHLLSAVEVCRKNHVPAWEAVALLELARSETMGTRARAERMEAARAITERLGLRLVREQVADLAGPSAAGRLTRREVEVVELVATGMTNAQIAAQLFLSERTIENHVSHAMMKLGVTSRTALALATRS